MDTDPLSAVALYAHGASDFDVVELVGWGSHGAVFKVRRGSGDPGLPAQPRVQSGKGMGKKTAGVVLRRADALPRGPCRCAAASPTTSS